MSAQSPAAHGWWLASRASGVVALILLSLTVLIGLAMAAKLLRRRGAMRQLLGAHEQIALVALIATAIHGVTLLGDPWLHPGAVGIAIPFAGAYRPLFTGLGIVAGYVAALLGLSFYLRRHIGPRLWRRVHRLTVVAWAMAMVHVLGAGTDTAAPWMRVLLITLAAPVVALSAWRAVPRGLPAGSSA
jgi:methionine sulfoxide reductase heme-binding subunit